MTVFVNSMEKCRQKRQETPMVGRKDTEIDTVSMSQCIEPVTVLASLDDSKL